MHKLIEKSGNVLCMIFVIFSISFLSQTAAESAEKGHEDSAVRTNDFVSEFGVASVALQIEKNNRVFKRVLPEMNIQWLRVVKFEWQSFEPNPPGSDGTPHYDWSKLDKIFSNIQKTDLEVSVVLNPTSYWAADPERLRKVLTKENKGRGNLPPTPANIKNWKRAVRDLFDRYNKDGTNDMPGLKRPFKHWQIGNESMHEVFWSGTVEEYLSVLKTAYEAKLELDPSIEIILTGIQNLAKRGDPEKNPRRNKPGYYSRALDFTKEMLKHPEWFDFVDIHFFNHHRLNPEAIDNGVAWIKREMQRNGYSKPIGSLEWTSMMTYSDRDNNPAYYKAWEKTMKTLILNPESETFDNVYGLFEEEQTKDFPKVYVTLAGNGLIRNLYVQFRDLPVVWESPQWDKQGLMEARTRGGDILRAKPIMKMYGVLNNLISGVRFEKSLKMVDNGTVIWLFKKKMGAIAFLWSDSGDSKYDLSYFKDKYGLSFAVREVDLLSGEKKPLSDELIFANDAPRAFEFQD